LTAQVQVFAIAALFAGMLMIDFVLAIVTAMSIDCIAAELAMINMTFLRQLRESTRSGWDYLLRIPLSEGYRMLQTYL